MSNENQKNHLKAYGIVYFALEVDINKLFYLELEKIINITPSKKTKHFTKTKKFQDFKKKDWESLWNNLKK